MRFHVLGLARSKTNLEYNSCSFTQEIWDFCKMMKRLGHEVIHYGNEGSCPECDEQVDILSSREFDFFYGKDYNTGSKEYCENPTIGWPVFVHRVVSELRKRVKDKKKEFIIAFWGNTFGPILEEDLGIFVEAGIGYTGWFARHLVFRSYFWWAMCMQNDESFMQNIDYWYTVVIPCYFDPAMYSFSEEKEDYYLMIARLVESKGFHIVMQIAEKTGIKVKVAGQGNPAFLNNHPNIEYVGKANVQQRSELYKNAIATFSPTVYMEPFGRVSMESQAAGTPVITSDWGGFPETVVHGKTGFRCRSFQDFLEAVERVKELSPHDCRDYVVKNYSVSRVSLMYLDYFEKLLDKYNGKGWYEIRERIVKPLDWLNKWYPSDISV